MGAAMLVTRFLRLWLQVRSSATAADAYILDIASKPGGTDFACARECGIRADLALGLPGKYAPKESAYILDRAVERFVRKEHEM